MTLPEEAGKVATSAIDVFKTQPVLLFVLLLNLTFIGVSYFNQREQRAREDVQWSVVLNKCLPGRDKN